jgi:hypothetical protein
MPKNFFPYYIKTSSQTGEAQSPWTRELLNGTTSGAGLSELVNSLTPSIADVQPYWVVYQGTKPSNYFRYLELSSALKDMSLADEDEDRIEPEVYRHACAYAAEVIQRHLPVPKIFSHGPQSVVFNWHNGGLNRYLTISRNSLSILISNSAKIIRRKDVQPTLGPELLNTVLLDAASEGTTLPMSNSSAPVGIE